MIHRVDETLYLKRAGGVHLFQRRRRAIGRNGSSTRTIPVYVAHSLIEAIDKIDRTVDAIIAVVGDGCIAVDGHDVLRASMIDP